MAESTDRPDRYGLPSILLHWLGAALIVAAFVFGYRMEDAPRTTSLWMYRTHALIGLAILTVTAGRLLGHALGTRPAPPPGLAGRHRAAVAWVHAGLHALTLVMVASGIALALRSGAVHVMWSAEAHGAPIIEPDPAGSVHGITSTVLGALVLAHVVGVVVQQVRFGGTLRRMLPRLRGSSEAASD